MPDAGMQVVGTLFRAVYRSLPRQTPALVACSAA